MDRRPGSGQAYFLGKMIEAERNVMGIVATDYEAKQYRPFVTTAATGARRVA